LVADNDGHRARSGSNSTYAFDDTAGGTLVFDSANWIPVPRPVEVSG
jgi:hypothetical protein